MGLFRHESTTQKVLNLSAGGPRRRLEEQVFKVVIKLFLPEGGQKTSKCHVALLTKSA